MSAPATPEFNTRTPTIQSGSTILLRLPNGDAKAVKIDKDSTVSLGRLGAFYANGLINEPFGRTYDIVEKKLTLIPPRTLAEVEDTDATNEYINDGEFVQPLTLEEIQALKQSGAHASEIIKMQIEQHANYSLKTEYSKEKYKKRKEAKYSKVFTTIEPTLFNVCEYWFKKDQTRIRDIRVDALSQILNMANIRPGGRYLAVDDASGLIVSGILERMGGMGRLITICNTDSPPAYPVMVNMNFTNETAAPLSSLNWATADQSHTPVVPPSDVPSDQIKSDRQKSRLNKRKAATDLLNSTREDLFAGEFDALIVASEYEPFSILEKLVPYVAGSGSIVVQSPYGQILSDLHTKLRALPGYLCPSVTEVWLRRYQVLPGRTHPTMNTSGSGGFILHAIKVYNDENANAITSHRRSKPNANSSSSNGKIIIAADPADASMEDANETS
ncbi:tRNA (Adenine(58)-N(1))-methyltransferase non-catalytic subunit TRM6 [Mycena venus]|uniref:tRNA (adenine(58)-N(1))-methyltransferase non-catalytic subunit TRM6 n=1 Tax=Mycena venus TaxID=2733690 RepID=A0A8H6XWC0_9AGAR|nr:tRNA (Adenine(58)-N(1))-methyltransferase non-catalytic subunit TRM6 [Mycena venus]